MIEINVWMPTTRIFGKKIKNALGSFFSESLDENAGHVNIMLTVPEGTATFEKLEQNQHDIMYEKSLAFVGKSVKENSVIGVSEGGTLKFWRPEKVRADVVTHSFWPKTQPSRKSVFQDILHLMHLAKPNEGVESEILRHTDDMEREAILGDFSVIDHRVALGKDDPRTASLRIKKEKNLKLATEASDLETALEEKETVEKKIQALGTSKVDLLMQQTALEAQYDSQKRALALQQSQLEDQRNELIKKENFTKSSLRYVEKIPYPDAKMTNELAKLKRQLSAFELQRNIIELQMVSLDEEMKNMEAQYQTDLLDVHTKLKCVQSDISACQNTLQELESQIGGRTLGKARGLQALYRKGVDLLQREEHYRLHSNKTKGRASDHSVCLPTKQAGLRAYVDEDLVLEAMMIEQKKNYSFILSNCAASAKRCILAGIQPIKQDLIDAGFTEKDFQVQTPETCKSIRTWMRKLDATFTMINTRVNTTKIDADPEATTVPNLGLSF